MEKIKRQDFNKLFEALKAEGYEICGPTLRGQVIVYDILDDVNDLPIGWADEQEKGRYRLKERADKALFGYVVGPHSWKKYLFPSRVKLWEVQRDQNGFHIQDEKKPLPKYAFLGVRACEIAAIDIQDKVFLGGAYVDPVYEGRRREIFMIAVNCTQAAATCFCGSMKTGPKAKAGFDLALTEVLNGSEHYFLAEAGTDKGRALLAQIPHEHAKEIEKEEAARAIQNAESQQRSLETKDIHGLLMGNLNHPHWEEVAGRCLACANCTLVCPTCFCSTVEDVSDLTGDHAERWRLWDSCFNLDHSFIHGSYIRTSTSSRYRQWLTHKLDTWIDQFGTSGCVGCGRCITWCPVGIDMTEEAAEIRGKQPVPAKPS